MNQIQQVAAFGVLTLVTGGAFLGAAPPVHEGFGGIWVLNRDRGDAPGSPNVPDARAEGNGGRGGGHGGGGGGGRRGGGGFGGRGGGGESTGQEEDLGRREAIMNYMRTSMEASRQLTIVVHEDGVNITDAEGRVQSLKTDNKKTDERAENGLVKLSRKARWEGDALVCEIDIESGPAVVRRYTLSPGGTQLEVSTTINGFRGGSPTKLLRMYDRPVEPR
jgi:hypothetical protein